MKAVARTKVILCLWFSDLSLQLNKCRIILRLLPIASSFLPPPDTLLSSLKLIHELTELCTLVPPNLKNGGKVTDLFSKVLVNIFIFTLVPKHTCCKTLAGCFVVSSTHSLHRKFVLYLWQTLQLPGQLSNSKKKKILSNLVRPRCKYILVHQFISRRSPREKRN